MTSVSFAGKRYGPEQIRVVPCESEMLYPAFSRLPAHLKGLTFLLKYPGAPVG